MSGRWGVGLEGELEGDLTVGVAGGARDDAGLRRHGGRPATLAATAEAACGDGAEAGARHRVGDGIELAGEVAGSVDGDALHGDGVLERGNDRPAVGGEDHLDDVDVERAG